MDRRQITNVFNTALFQTMLTPIRRQFEERVLVANCDQPITAEDVLYLYLHSRQGSSAENILTNDAPTKREFRGAARLINREGGVPKLDLTAIEQYDRTSLEQLVDRYLESWQMVQTTIDIDLKLR